VGHASPAAGNDATPRDERNEMPGFAQVPESGQGGGSSVSDVEVEQITAMLLERPWDVEQDPETPSAVMADARDVFKIREGDEDPADAARRRTSSAADRMRDKVAKALGLKKGLDVKQATRAVAWSDESKQHPTEYGYFVRLTVQGATTLRNRAQQAAEVEQAASEVEDAEQAQAS
jgi:hypothetical protein